MASKTYKTTREIKAFRHNALSGARTKLTVPAGAQIRGISNDHYDALYGEPVFWFEVELDGAWEVAGAINLPGKVSSWAAKTN